MCTHSLFSPQRLYIHFVRMEYVERERELSLSHKDSVDSCAISMRRRTIKFAGRERVAPRRQKGGSHLIIIEFEFRHFRCLNEIERERPLYLILWCVEQCSRKNYCVRAREREVSIIYGFYYIEATLYILRIN